MINYFKLTAKIVINSTSTVIAPLVIIMMLCLSSCAKKDDAGQPEAVTAVAVTKTNPIKVYMHYMPWFQSKPISGYWGTHWRMTNRNPDIIDVNGQREIASHYYPLIGPYDSKDPDVIDYHLLLMKYAGVDAILIDWYGSHQVNDYGINLSNSNAIIDRLEDVGVQFGIVYEEYTAQISGPGSTDNAIKAAQTDMSYMDTNYWNKKTHISINGVPLLLTFGPRFFTQPSQWDKIFSVLNTKPKFLPLWDHSGDVGDNAVGEFSWVDFSAGQKSLSTFYLENKPPNFQFIIGSAFPGYHDYYVEGGEGTSNGYVDFSNGDTMKATLAQSKKGPLSFLQLVTWNDFGEGTVIEPTAENQFTCLEILQQFTGVPYGTDELHLVYNYYLKTQKYKNDASVKKTLSQVFDDLRSLKVSEATTLLATIPD